MKKMMNLVLTGLLVASAAQAETISCKSRDGDLAAFHKVTNSKGEAIWETTVDEALSSKYIGAITKDDHRFGWLNTKGSTPKSIVISDWDGNSGFDFEIPRTAFKHPEQFRNRSFPAKLTVYYNDIAEETVTNKLSCIVQ